MKNNNQPIPEWQKKEVKKRLRAIKKDPHRLISAKEALRFLKRLRVK